MERQLVVQAQGGGGEGRFGDLRDGTKGLSVIAAVTDPMHYPTGHFFSADTAAVPAEDVPGEGRAGRRGAPVEPLFPSRDQLLHPLEVLMADDAGVVVLHLVPGLLPSVFHLLDGQHVRGAGLLPVRIAGVEAVGQDVADHGAVPPLPAMAPVNT